MSILLPGPQRPAGGLTLYVPRGAERRKTGECFLCGSEFAEGDDVMRHMRGCIPAAGHDVRAEHEEKKERLHIFQRDAWDPEVEDHLRGVGKRMIVEGRLVVKPNERAGFS